MKASELIAVVQERIEKYGDLDVLVAWEGIVRPLTPSCVYGSKGDPPFLAIDGDECYYKKDAALDPSEGGPPCHE